MKRTKLITFGALAILALSSCDRAPQSVRKYKEATPLWVDQTLPTVEWVREQLRLRIAQVNGVPVNRNNPMPCFRAPEWRDDQDDNGERYWRVGFEIDGQGYDFYGHGTTIGDGEPVGPQRNGTFRSARP
jgi:hypothetical protein